MEDAFISVELLYFYLDSTRQFEGEARPCYAVVFSDEYRFAMVVSNQVHGFLIWFSKIFYLSTKDYSRFETNLFVLRANI